jgi:hypothetical protein
MSASTIGAGRRAASSESGQGMGHPLYCAGSHGADSWDQEGIGLVSGLRRLATATGIRATRRLVSLTVFSRTDRTVPDYGIYAGHLVGR